MTKHELAEKVSLAVNADAADCTRDTFTDTATVVAVINAFTEVVKTAVATGEAVTIRGFGSFEPKHRAAKLARNITKGVGIEVPAHMTPVFVPSKEFKEKVRTSALGDFNPEPHPLSF